ncbi:helix-turn-helix domain-containing protein [Pseudomonas meliae]|uniref:HTH cro/C1-type domain-containing protein n=1 Tax=Pseudomonas meliae TaxID=86176 RepID=A0A0P9UXC7_9PSED|nr:Uncharacterized protein ALO64_00506 [Pseudomonas meliae]
MVYIHPIRNASVDAEAIHAAGPANRLNHLRSGTCAGIDRSHMGKIERGEHMPTLAIILRVAEALGVTSALLMAETEENLKSLREPPDTKD